MISETEVREKYHRITLLLIRKGLTVTTMESATSGQIASLITDTEGASAVLRGAFITYSNEAKIQMGVPEEILRKYSVYSRETAEAMAETARAALGADIGIGLTGTMGNTDPENAAFSVPGTIYFAISTDGGTFSYKVHIPPEETRLLSKLSAANEVADRLLPLLL